MFRSGTMRRAGSPRQESGPSARLSDSVTILMSTGGGPAQKVPRKETLS
ncbi:hypothetical protein SFOMI_1056 [Sphingobium fuliginis]|uniref:Uncharacterized protein n=1 Tax=Sphingobium fuliginis (strain ATCC 27551) TaxID=336203 RepID=A0A292ZCB7_SPHSA|nr:hypothetical protein SFOMI_1056 [Sphingobium fuliginis]